MAINDDIAASFVDHAVDLSQLSEDARKRALSLLHDLQNDVRTKLEDAAVEGKLGTVRAKRLNQLFDDIQRSTGKTYTALNRLDQRILRSVGDVTASRTKDVLNTAFKVNITQVTLTPKELELLATRNLVQGLPSSDWWARQSQKTQADFQRAVRLGIASGETNEQIVKRVIGTPTGKTTEILRGTRKVKVPERIGGVMQATQRDATALVRTSVQAHSNRVLMETYRANADVLAGMQLIVTLDARTTDICMSRSGAAWDFEGNPLPDSPSTEPWPGPPPYHFQCRSVLSPVTKSIDAMREELGLTGGKPLPGVSQIKNPVQSRQAPSLSGASAARKRGLRRTLDRIPAKNRISVDGRVAGNLTYEGWLETLLPTRQLEILGPNRLSMWKRGDISLRDLVSTQGRSLTLEELNARVAARKAREQGKLPAEDVRRDLPDKPTVPTTPSAPSAILEDVDTAVLDGKVKRELSRVGKAGRMTKKELQALEAWKGSTGDIRSVERRLASGDLTEVPLRLKTFDKALTRLPVYSGAAHRVLEVSQKELAELIQAEGAVDASTSYTINGSALEDLLSDAFSGLGSGRTVVLHRAILAGQPYLGPIVKEFADEFEVIMKRGTRYAQPTVFWEKLGDKVYLVIEQEQLR